MSNGRDVVYATHVYAANSQFLTHLVGRMLGSVGDLRSTPIDTKGFRFHPALPRRRGRFFDLFYGLYRYNQHSKSTLMSAEGHGRFGVAAHLLRTRW